MDIHKRDFQVKAKERFAAIPQRAAIDSRLTQRHWQVLAVVASYDRLGRNGQGCWISRKDIADSLGMSDENVSHALSDLRRFGYISSEAHPTDERKKIHRVLYTAADNDALVTSRRRKHLSEQNRCEQGH
jgi:DNA-binding MarR family transcriptional regulator